jgi:outer membrane protein assembly factor BamB
MEKLSRRAFARVVTGSPWIAAALGGWTGWRTSPASAAVEPLTQLPAKAPDFAFIHLSDTHLDPRPTGHAYRGGGRSVDVLGWISEKTRTLIGAGAKADPAGKLPAFAIHTGDVFEYSVVDDCWGDWDRAVADAACPIYCVPGNHDNTWGMINAILRKRHGGDSYSFDHEGLHFVCLNTAGSLDPLPCWDERTLRWLRADLTKVSPETPILMAFHHPLTGNSGYASEYDKLRFWEVVRGHNVVYMMDGHWHQVQADTWQNIPRVNGGETFRDNTGYATVRIADGKLTQRYHFHRTAKGGRRGALVARHCIDQPAPRFVSELRARLDTDSNAVRVAGHVTANSPELLNDDVIATAWIDGENRTAVTLSLSNPDNVSSARREFAASLPTESLPLGRHYLTVRFERPDLLTKLDSKVGNEPRTVANEQAIEFEIAPAPSSGVEATHYRNAAGITSPLLIVRDESPLMVFGDTAGVVTALDAATMEPVWRYETQSEILHSVTLCGEVIAVGDSDGRLHLLSAASGKPAEVLDLGAPLFGAGELVDGVLYLADANGALHAIDIDMRRSLWHSDVAEFAIEMAPVYDAANDRLIVGAWDGLIYSVDRLTGELAWKKWGPMGEKAEKPSKSRYFGPAESPAIVVNDEVWVADRGYCLGRYRAADGEWLGVAGGQDIAGVSVLYDGQEAIGIMARGRLNQLLRLDLSGDIIWSTEVPLGRCPNPPVQADAIGAIGIVSDTGLLSVVDAKSGNVRQQYSLTPKLFVLSGLSYCNATSSWYAAGMDGVVTRVAIS